MRNGRNVDCCLTVCLPRLLLSSSKGPPRAEGDHLHRGRLDALAFTPLSLLFGLVDIRSTARHSIAEELLKSALPFEKAPYGRWEAGIADVREHTQGSWQIHQVTCRRLDNTKTKILSRR